MSIRTIIEINHDQLRKLQEDPEWAKQLYDCLATHSWTSEDRTARGSSFPAPQGVRVLIDRHHSDDLWIGYEKNRVTEMG